MRLLLCILLYATGDFLVFCSFCGQHGVPFSVEILPSGAPVLGCAQPSCLALAEGEDDSQFSTDQQGQFDGYFRDEERAVHLQANKLAANCSGTFDSLTCPRKNQWVGGIEYVDHERQPLILQCCSFDGLRFSQDVGVTTITVGEAVTGGEVIRDGRQISFDVIANIKKVIDGHSDGSVYYEVTIRRMNCLPDPHEVEVPVDEGVPAEISRVLRQNQNRSPLNEEDAGDAFPHSYKHTEKIKNHPSKQQLTYGATIFDPSSKDVKQVKSRYLEKRPTSEFSTTTNPLPAPVHVYPSPPPNQAPSQVYPSPTSPQQLPPPPPPSAPVQQTGNIVYPSHPQPTQAPRVHSLLTSTPSPFALFNPFVFGLPQAPLFPAAPPAPAPFNPFVPFQPLNMFALFGGGGAPRQSAFQPVLNEASPSSTLSPFFAPPLFPGQAGK